MVLVNNLLNELASYTLNFGWSIARPVLQLFVVDQTDSISKTVRLRFVYSGVSKSAYSANASALAGVEELYRSINFGGFMGVNRRMEDSINYGMLMAAAETMDGGLNVSPVFSVVSNVKRGYNFGGVALCHETIREDAYHAGAIAVAGTVKGRMRGVFTYCDVNYGDVVGLVNVTGKNKLSDRREKDRRIKGKQRGLVNIDLSKRWYDGGVSFGWS